MSKLLVVFGATGQQGGSVVDFVLNDSELSKEYSLRAITRDVSQPAAQELLKKGVEVIAGDVDDLASLPAALTQAHTVFLVTNTAYDQDLKAREFRQSKNVADSAVAAGAQYIIFSTCPAASRLCNQPVAAFDSKADIETYIRSLPVNSAFFAPGMFMQNFLSSQAPREDPAFAAGVTTYSIKNFISPDALFPCIDTVQDSGKYVGAILADPDKYAGTVFSASTRFYSYQKCAEIITRVTGKKTVYVQLPHDQWSAYLPPDSSGPMTEMFRFIENHGYYGPRSKEDVEWTVQQARGRLTSFEEFVEEHAEEMFAK